MKALHIRMPSQMQWRASVGLFGRQMLCDCVAMLAASTFLSWEVTDSVARAAGFLFWFQLAWWVRLVSLELVFRFLVFVAWAHLIRTRPLVFGTLSAITMIATEEIWRALTMGADYPMLWMDRATMTFLCAGAFSAFAFPMLVRASLGDTSKLR